MAFGIFESALSSEQEVGLAKQAAVDKRQAAIYDVREKLGPSLFAARDLHEFRDRVAMMKNDQSVYRVIEPHIHPSTGVVRSIVGKNSVLEKEFKAKQEALRSAGLLKEAPFAGYKDFDACTSANSDKDNPDAYCGKIKHQVEGAQKPPADIGSDEFYERALKDFPSFDPPGSGRLKKEPSSRENPKKSGRRANAAVIPGAPTAVALQTPRQKTRP